MNSKLISKLLLYFTFVSNIYSANPALSNNVDPGDLVNRVIYLEEKIRYLNGKVEELEHLKQEVDKKFEDFEKNSKELIASLQKSISNQNDNKALENKENGLSNKKEVKPVKNELMMQKYNNITNHLNAKKHDLAEKEMLNFVKEYSNNDLSAKIYFMLGEMKYNKGLYESASLQYLYSYKNFSKSEYAPKSLYKLSLCLEKIKKHKEMCSALSKIIKEYPTADKKIVDLAKSKKIKQQCNS